MTEQIRVCIRKQRQVLTSSAHSKLKRKKFSHLYNGPLAVGTTRREELMVVFVTVRPSLSLKEACGAQLHLTGSTHKVFRVPHFTQSCDHLQNREKKQVQWKREEVCICFIFFYYYYYSDFRTYNTSMLVRLFNIPFPQCIYCRKHSGPWLWCVHQSSPSQSSALLAGHR